VPLDPVVEALTEQLSTFVEPMSALGSKDGREVVRELDKLYASGKLGRQEDGRYVLTTRPQDLGSGPIN